MPYYTFHIKICFNKNLRVIWPREQFKVGPFFLKHPVKRASSTRYDVQPQPSFLLRGIYHKIQKLPHQRILVRKPP